MVTAKVIKDVNPMSDEKYQELEVGKEYIVEDISMGQSLTYVQLEGVNNFINSICLDFYEDGKELNNDKRFNPYLK